MSRTALRVVSLMALLHAWTPAALARPALADDPPKPAATATAPPAELLAALEAEIDALKIRVRSLEDAVADLRDNLASVRAISTPPASIPRSEAIATPSAADGGRAPRVPPALTSDAPSVALGGYGSFRFDAGAGDRPDSMTLRRFVLTTDARISDRVRAYSEIEYERFGKIEIERSAGREAGGLAFEQELEGPGGSEIALEQAWGELTLSPAFNVRIGAVLPPVGRFNIRHDDNQWDFARRPLIDRGANVLPAPAAWTELGVGINGEVELGDSVLSYEAYLLNGIRLNSSIEQQVQTREPSRDRLALEAVVGPAAGAFDGSDPADAFAGRLAFSPALGSEIAVSGYYGDYSPSYLNTSGHLFTLGLDGEQRVGPLRLEGELLYTRYGNLEGVLRDFAAAAVDQGAETEADETDELESEVEIAVHELSRSRYGFWVDLGYPIVLQPGFLGFSDPVLVPSVRYERVWFRDDLAGFEFADGVVTALEQQDRQQDRLQVGFAFRPASLAVLHVFYERDHAFDGPLLDPMVAGSTAHAFTVGFAIGF